MSKTKVISYFAVTIILSLLAFTPGCITVVTPGSGPIVTGSGTLETQEMNYSGFTKIDASNAFQVEINKSDTFRISITMDDNMFDYLEIKKVGDTLYIGLEPNHTYRDNIHRAIITMTELRELELSGASRGDIGGFSSVNSLRLEASGASKLNIGDVEVGNAKFNISGASRVSGSIKIADGDFDVSGASFIELEGDAVDVTVGASGASSMKLEGFSVVNATVEFSGASNGTINTSGSLDCNLSGASRLSYVGNPTLGSISVSGGSTINPK